MRPRNRNHRSLAGLLSFVLLAAPLWADTAQEQLHRAYYLERETGDLAAAAELYGKVAATRDASDTIRDEARDRAAGCREELACSDFAALMPPEAIVYAEINKPGEQLSRLLRQLGLLADSNDLGGALERHIAIDPTLVSELLGIRGVAAAITAIDPRGEAPSGLAVLHPGNLQVIRALIATALPAAAEPTDPIGGFATFDIEGKVFVTLTHRLVIASPERHEIEGVVARLTGKSNQSLASNPNIARNLAGREDSLLFVCANFKQVMPQLMALLQEEIDEEPELAMIETLLDPRSLNSAVLRAGVTDDGVRFDLALTLDEGHHNLAFNFMRMPSIDENSLRFVPAGAAAFASFALNDADARLTLRPDAPAESPPVSFMDFGRELFANIIGVTVFVLPDANEGSIDGEPLPGIAAVMTVHDPAKSRALWSQMLGIASMAAGASSLTGDDAEIKGVEAVRFELPEGVRMYLAARENALILSPSKAAVARAAAAVGGGGSIGSDPAFSSALSQLGADGTLAICAHAGRCLQIAKDHMSNHDREEMAAFEDLLADAVATIVFSHGDNELRASAHLSGLPNVAPILSQMLANEHPRFTQSRSRSGTAVQHRDRRVQEFSTWEQFERAIVNGDIDAARKLADQLYDAHHDDADQLNTYAWRMLTEEPFAGRCTRSGLRFAERANELTGYESWMYVDTLARAHFERDELSRAIEWQRKAVELAGDDARRDEAEAALARYQEAFSAQKAAKLN